MKPIALAFALLLAAAPSAQAARTGDMFGAWMVRCGGPGAVQACEAFQRLTQAESGARVIEFAIGYPPPSPEEAGRKGSAASAIAPAAKAVMGAGGSPARGVIVLPLGIMLPDGVSLRIDKKYSYAFEIRYCTADGCYAYIDLPSGTMDILRRAMSAEVTFRTLDKQDMSLKLEMKGLAAALQAIR